MHEKLILMFLFRFISLRIQNSGISKYDKLNFVQNRFPLATIYHQAQV